MATEITHIDCPKEWESANDWDSHLPMLYRALEKTTGNITEIGSGLGSTPKLSRYCIANSRRFFSFETNKEWAEKTGSVYISNYLNLASLFEDDGIRRLYMDIGLLFIDCAPGDIRKDLITLFANNAKVIIAHDTESGADYVYGMAEVLNTFKYRLDYKPEGKPHTTAVSNYINVEEWKSI